MEKGFEQRVNQYEAAIPAQCRAREDELFELPSAANELEIQARWFAGDYGCEFTGMDGESVHVIQFGVWNREAGPDFTDAAVQINGETVRGCIEIDIDERDWERHGHAMNPSFDSVVLHVVLSRGRARFFTRTSQGRQVVQVVPARSGNTTPSCLPPVAHAGRCVAPLARLDAETLRTLLETAAFHRLRRKGARLARLARAHGPDEALLMGVAEALGYRENKLPFLLLAQRLGLTFLQRAPVEAVLLGVSGFLEESSLGGAQDEYVARLWQDWWPLRASLERLLIPRRFWKLGASRPANHPQRRLAALALIVARWKKFRDVAQSAESDRIEAFFNDLHHPYWDHHSALGRRALPRPLALVGCDRSREILLNVIGPAALHNDPGVLGRLGHIRPGARSRTVDIACRRLFGDRQDLAKRALGSALAEQGLIQIFEDFCRQDASNCERCRFPELATKWH